MIPIGLTATHVMYANEKMLKDMGLSVPKTYEELKSMVPKLQAAGKDVILMGAHDDWVVQSCLYSMIVGRMIGDEYIDKILEGEARFTDAPFVRTVAAESGVALIGCDCGVNGSDAPVLGEIGHEIYKKHGIGMLGEVIDRVCAEMALRLVDVAVEKGMVPPNSSIGFTGRAAISGRKPEYILEGIIERNLYEKPNDHLVFVDDGLARGAALMARCMNSLGKPKSPLGGVRGGPCIMSRRIKIGK